MSLSTSASAGPSTPPNPSLTNDPHQIVLDYLRSRGFKKTEQALREELDVGGDKETTHIHHGLSKLLASLDAAGAEEILSLDPSDRAEGFRDLESWVDGSLDMYRVSIFETRQIQDLAWSITYIFFQCSRSSDLYYFLFLCTSISI